MRWLILGLIRGYQLIFSPDHGLIKPLFPDGFCRFYPSCSQYGYECIASRGLIKGGLLTAWRILRCNPFLLGGIDEPPAKKI
jgi:putative membrane protein insertion efficiency factor